MYVVIHHEIAQVNMDVTLNNFRDWHRYVAQKGTRDWEQKPWCCFSSFLQSKKLFSLYSDFFRLKLKQASKRYTKVSAVIGREG